MVRINLALAAHMNVFRFDINAMSAVSSSAGINSLDEQLSSDPNVYPPYVKGSIWNSYDYKYTIDVDNYGPIDYYVFKSTVMKIAALAKAAKDYNFWLLPVIGSVGSYDSGEETMYPRHAAVMVHAIATELFTNQKDKDSYDRILCYELENELTHYWHHPNWDRDTSATMLADASNSVRTAEFDVIGNIFEQKKILINYALDYDRTVGASRDNAVSKMISYYEKVFEKNGHIDILAVDYYPDDANPENHYFPHGYSYDSWDSLTDIISKLSQKFGRGTQYNTQILITETGTSEVGTLRPGFIIPGFNGLDYNQGSLLCDNSKMN
jgi:hypothetical protein